MGDERQRSMSLVPYASAESREVVLRHGSAVVVYDQRSRQLSLRDASNSDAVEITSCPYCHRAFREPSPHNEEHDEQHEHGGLQDAESGFVNPGYFQMLRMSQPGSTEVSRPPSPHKQLAPAPDSVRDAYGGEEDRLNGPAGTQFVGSTPVPPRHQGISARAFSPNYFKSFFVTERELGRGGKGVVLLVRHMLDGVPLGQFACKRVPVGDDHEWLEKVLIEVQLLQNLSHQNLVSYRHVWLEDYQISSFGPSVPCAFILQQYCNGGDLQGYVLEGMKRGEVSNEMLKERLRRRSKGQLDQPVDLNGPRRMHFEEILSFFKDITSGLNHLHANGYIHRDLKPSNCLLHNNGRKMRVLVSDFGEVQATNMTRRSTGATGTISYCAPEVLQPERPGGPLGEFTTKSDIFSLGMIVYFMCFARLPYRNADGIDEDNEDLDRLREEISAWVGFNDEKRVRPDLPEKLYRSLKHLLSLHPDERPGTEEILHVFKSPSVIDEFGGFTAGGPAGLEELGSRISRADTPSPAPTATHRKRNSVHYSRPGPSKLGSLSATVGDSRSPSPPTKSAPRTPTPPKSGPSEVVLRPRKIDLPKPEISDGQSDMNVSPRLMLPPSAPQSLSSRFHALIHNPTFVSIVKVLLFAAKLVSMFSPCQPFAANPWVAYPLLCFASIDFLFVGFQVRGRWIGNLGSSGVLLAVHLAALAWAMRWEMLCASSGMNWEGL